MLKGPLIPTLSLAIGIAISAGCRSSWWWGGILIAIALLLYLIILKASKNPISAFRLGKLHVVWSFLLFLGIGLTDESLNRPLDLEKAFGGIKPDSLICEVTTVLTKTYGERIDVIIDGTNGARARIRSGVKELSPGDVIRIPTAYLKDISSDTTEIGQRIKPMMKAAGVLYTGRIIPNKIEVVGRSSGLRYFFIDLREKIEKTIEKSHIKRPTADFLNAILMGDKTGLDDQTRLTFANGGMAHVLALSGLHIGILAGFLLLVMWPLKLTGRYKWGYWGAIIILWLYAAVTGLAYSSVRACIMTTFAFIGIIAERKNFAGNALCSACLLILLVDPYALFDAGFQLSVVCVGALIAFASRLNPIDHRNHPLLYYISGSLIATMIATAASWVLTSYYFSQVPLMFLPSNLLLLPILPIYLSIAVFFVTLLTLGIELDWIGSLLDHGYDLLLRSVEWLSCGTEFVIEYQTPLWGVAIWMLLLASGAYAINRKQLK
ncbi:MAG: ComEC/Rec2 family competence protein [Muribaculaceae bacterium]|nr:ComEC/Rec2 family competence protein [Muribaculaceae bacterium]